MEHAASSDRLERFAVARLLVMLQAAILIAATIEAMVFATLFGPVVIPGAVLGAGSAALALVMAWRLGTGAPWARRWTIVAEIGVLGLAGVDGVIAFATGGGMPLVSVLTRVVLPIAVIVELVRAGRR